MLGISAIRLAFDGDAMRLSLTDAEGEHGVDAGHERWVETTTDLRGASLHHGYRLRDAPTIASGRWIASNEYELVLHFVESDRKSTRLNSSHSCAYSMTSSASNTQKNSKTKS